MLNQPLCHRTHLLFALLSIGFVLTINNILSPNMVFGKLLAPSKHGDLLTQPMNKSSIYPTFSNNLEVPGNHRSATSNLIGPYKLSSSNSTLYSTFSIPSGSTFA